MASLNLNKVIIVGRLTAPPELKSTSNGIYVTQITVAVNRIPSADGKVTADFINVIAWRQTAEFISKYFRKGSSICVIGAIQTRTWKDKNGNNRYSTEVLAEEVRFVDSKGEISNAVPTGNAPVSNPASEGNKAPPAQMAITSQTAPEFEELSEDDDLPFLGE